MEGKLKKGTLFYLLAILLSPLPALAASFTADLVITENGKTETGKFYLLNQCYRMDLTEDGKPMVIIADREKNVHQILDMEEKVFFEIPSNHFRVLSNDPFKASEYMASKYDRKVQGTEKIAGIVCEKQDLFSQKKRLHSRWLSNKMKFPLKLFTYDGGKEFQIIELQTIRKISLDKDLFVPPAGFKQVEEPGAAAKRKREKQETQEAALPGLKKVKTVQVPCYERKGKEVAEIGTSMMTSAARQVALWWMRYESR